jgi:hypothetical protein
MTEAQLLDVLRAMQDQLADIREETREIIGMMDKILRECAEARAERLRQKVGSLA